MTHTRILLFLLAIVLLAACGGDDGSQDPILPVTPPPETMETARFNWPQARAIATSPDGSQIAISRGDTIWLYTADLEPLRALTGHGDAVRALAPQVILLAPTWDDPAAFRTNPAYRDVPAIRAERVTRLPFSPTLPADPGAALIWLAAHLHGD